jgi:hypothetical protein
MGPPDAEPRAVPFLLPDTGGGHRRAAEAVIAALPARHPGAFRPVVCDPLARGGRLLRWPATLVRAGDPEGTLKGGPVPLPEPGNGITGMAERAQGAGRAAAGGPSS